MRGGGGEEPLPDPAHQAEGRGLEYRFLVRIWAKRMSQLLQASFDSISDSSSSSRGPLGP
jgi:hypothetical protein